MASGHGTEPAHQQRVQRKEDDILSFERVAVPLIAARRDVEIEERVQRARRLRTGSTSSRHADGRPGSGTYPMKTAATTPTTSTPIRVTRNGSATARTASSQDAPDAAARESLAVLSRIHMQSVAPKSPRFAAAVVAVAVLGTRLPVLLCGALAVTIVGTVPPPAAEAVWRVSSHELANLLARWDTFYYYTIASDGYHWDPSVFRHYNVVFFPLYPLLMRWGGAALGGHPLLAGLIRVAGGFRRRAAAALPARGPRARRGLRLARRPAALDLSLRAVLLAVYTESLFLLLSVGAFYAMRRGSLGWVAACGFAAGLTRPNGFWLALPLASSPSGRQGGSGRVRARVLRSRGRWRCSRPACRCSASRCSRAILQLRFGDALAWVHGQAAWGVPLLLRAGAPDPGKLPGEAIVKPIEVIAWMGNIAAFIAAVCAIRPISRKLGPAYGAWIAVNIFPPVAAHLFMSLGRFASVLFPLFFWLAIRIPRDRVRRVAFAFAAGQALFATWFFLWRPVV